ncbi:P-loop containing nucleoside triphosphate hydrolase protein [Auriculariales sp. MPI-PUGE-AT-0066]|nr:P-loop containing nucleoside triphosphate hydrolase protein [Auriculariales sp. MPI-PUGE-AT-0066]
MALDASYDTLKFGLRAMVSMSEGLPWPLKAAPQTALQVIKQLEYYRISAVSISMSTTLLLAIRDLSQVLIEHYGKSGNEHDMSPYIREFMHDLQIISIRLRIYRATTKLKKVAAAVQIQALIKEEKARLAHARNVLMTAFAASTHSIVIDIKNILTTPMMVPTVVTRSIVGITSKPPMMPIVFHGRDAQVERLVQYMLAEPSARLAIIGPGGVGKTSLALAALNDRRVKNRFGDRRLWLPCDAISDEDVLLTVIAQMLALPLAGDVLGSFAEHIKINPGGTVLVLDNLETVWISKDLVLSSKLELLLARLASIEELVCIITARAEAPPRTVSWTNAPEVLLGPFDVEAARESFIELTGHVWYPPKEQSCLNELMSETNGMPLAVRLLGRLQLQPSELIPRWKELHPTVAQQSNLPRTPYKICVEVAIQLSLTVLPRPEFDLEPIQLLTICAVLPDGLFPDTTECIRPLFRRLDKTLDLVRSQGLVYDGVRGETKMLGPVRDFIQAHHEIAHQYLKALRTRYDQLAQILPQEPAEGFAMKVVQVAPELGNLMSLLLHIIATQEPDATLVCTVQSVTQFLFWTTPSPTLSEALLRRLFNYPMWRADCLFDLCRVYERRQEYTRAIAYGTGARELYQDTAKAAKCTLAIINCQRLQNLAAEDERERALGALATIPMPAPWT